MSSNADLKPARPARKFTVPGLGAGLGAILFTLTTGYVVDHYSYTPILVTSALLPWLATIILFALGGKIRPQTFIKKSILKTKTDDYVNQQLN